jgi:hypothetical protein
MLFILIFRASCMTRTQQLGLFHINFLRAFVYNPKRQLGPFHINFLCAFRVRSLQDDPCFMLIFSCLRVQKIRV